MVTSFGRPGGHFPRQWLTGILGPDLQGDVLSTSVVSYLLYIVYIHIHYIYLYIYIMYFL